MRARTPDADGYVESNGVKIHYEVHGDGGPTILLLPTWTIVHKRFWKAQVPYLARHHRVVSYDGPGNGRSDRPLDPAAYDHDRQVQYAARRARRDRAPTRRSWSACPWLAAGRSNSPPSTATGCSARS